MLLKRMWCAAGTLLLAQVGAAQAPAAAVGRYAILPSTVAATLAEAGLPVAETRVHLPGSLSSRTNTPQLKVTVADRRANGSLEVRFSCRSSAECMPFFVTVDAADDPSAMTAFAARTLRDNSVPPRISASGIAVGDRVTLELTDTQMRIHLPTVAIDTGVPGAEVRVASLDRKQTWRGVVIDATTVRGGVQ